jgi:hypothetical protein
MKRPRILRAVAERVQQGEQGFDSAIREFLDYFCANPHRREQAIAEPPPLLGCTVPATHAAIRAGKVGVRRIGPNSGH